MKNVKFEEFRDHVLESVRSMGGTLKPDEDWAPVLFMLGPNGIDFALLVFDRDTKDAVPAGIAALFKKHKPTLAALVMTCWVRHIKMTDPLAETILEMCSALGIRNDPQRAEQVQLHVASDHESELWCADITRSNSHPALSKWENVSVRPEGRFANVLGKAFEEMKR